MSRTPIDGGRSTVRNTAAPALAAALYATFTTGFVQAAPVIVDIDPDVTLGMYDLVIGGNTLYSFLRVGDSCIPDPLNPLPCTFTTSVNTFANEVVGYVIPPTQAKPGTYASALAAGEIIDGSRAFVSDADGNPPFLAGKSPIPFGDFFNSGLAYVGLRFDLPTDVGPHYGWVEAIGSNGQVTLTRYGYESTPDTAVQTPGRVPEPGSLPLLIAGAVGVLALRRRQRMR